MATAGAGAPLGEAAIRLMTFQGSMFNVPVLIIKPFGCERMSCFY